jgi:F-type H+-transporting ATPase subunit b
LEPEHSVPTGAEHAAGEHASSGFPPFDQIDTFPSQVFWLVVTFGLLYLVATYWLIPTVKKAIVDRETAIANDVAEAAAASQKADAAAKALEARIAEAKARSRDTANKAKAEADARIAAETAKTEAALATRLVASEKSIADTRAKAMTNVSTVSEDLVSVIAEKLTGSKPDAAAVKRAVAAAMGKA